jgi:hypothetical protein
METAARATGLAGCARGRALGESVCGRTVVAAHVPRVHANDGAQHEPWRVPRISNR